MGYPPTFTPVPTLTETHIHKQTNIKQNKRGLEPNHQCQDHSLCKTSPIVQMPDSCLDKGQEGNRVECRPTTHTATSCSCFHRSQRIKWKVSASIGGIKLELPEISMQSRLTFFLKEALGVQRRSFYYLHYAKRRH